MQIGEVKIGAGEPLVLIAGPCVIESEGHALGLACGLRTIARERNISLIFKASYDKANRTSAGSYRGPGIQEGLRVLAEIKRATGLPILTDVHEPAQVGSVAEVCDVLQIPAFLCRQTDLLIEAGRSGRAVNIKKGQFLSPWDLAHAAEKVTSTGNSRVILTERGVSFGYNNLVVDMRSLVVLREFGFPVVLDVTHSVQLPGAGTDRTGAPASGGQPHFIEPLARAGVGAGVDGVFLEVHEQPARALSDGSNALRIDLLPMLLHRLVQIDRLVKPWLGKPAGSE